MYDNWLILALKKECCCKPTNKGWFIKTHERQRNHATSISNLIVKKNSTINTDIKINYAKNVD